MPRYTIPVKKNRHAFDAAFRQNYLTTCYALSRVTCLACRQLGEENDIVEEF